MLHISIVIIILLFIITKNKQLLTRAQCRTKVSLSDLQSLLSCVIRVHSLPPKCLIPPVPSVICLPLPQALPLCIHSVTLIVSTLSPSVTLDYMANPDPYVLGEEHL